MAELPWLQPEGLHLWISGVLILASGLTSFLSAALGLGGGIVLLAVMGSVMPVATMIPVHGVVQVGSNAGRMLIMIRHIRTDILLPFLIGSVVGGVIGGLVVVRVPSALLQIGLGAFIIWSTWGRMPTLRSSSLALGGTGLVSTFLTMFFGATGVFVAAIIKTMKFDRLAHIASHAACMTLQHGIKVMAFGLLGFAFGEYVPLILAMIVSGVLGTFAGRHVLIKATDERFHTILGWVLTFLALRLLWQGASAMMPA
ncbi:MAG: TSUP family transporter [Geminicoccaceae bacterium]